MKHRGLTDLMASSLGLIVVLAFACLDATNIPTISNDLRDALAQTDWTGAAPPVASAGQGGSAMTPSAGAGGGAGQDDEPLDPGGDGGAAGSGMAGVAGSAGNGGMEPSPVGGSCDGFAILELYCATSGCHGQPGAPLGDFASSEQAARAFIDQEGSLACAGQGTIIDTDNPSDSLLVSKTSGDPPCGQAMPPVGDPLTEEEVACLEEWIAGL